MVVIPNRIYNYRLGGGTSKFMAYMLEDFLALYRYKEKMSEQHPMPQDARYYMNIELMNIVFSWLTMCKKKGKYSEQEIYKEIERIYHIPEIYNLLINPFIVSFFRKFIMQQVNYVRWKIKTVLQI